jgi:hypothetical protein
MTDIFVAVRCVSSSTILFGGVFHNLLWGVVQGLSSQAVDNSGGAIRQNFRRET